MNFNVWKLRCSTIVGRLVARRSQRSIGHPASFGLRSSDLVSRRGNRFAKAFRRR